MRLPIDTWHKWVKLSQGNWPFQYKTKRKFERCHLSNPYPSLPKSNLFNAHTFRTQISYLSSPHSLQHLFANNSDGIYQFSVWWIHYNHCNAVNLPDKKLVNLTFVQYSTPLLAHFSRSTIQIMTKVSFSRCLHFGAESLLLCLWHEEAD